jgi:hypothetical protein
MWRLKRRYEKWKDWQKYCGYLWIKKILILLGIVKDYWFDHYEYISNAYRPVYISERKQSHDDRNSSRTLERNSRPKRRTD